MSASQSAAERKNSPRFPLYLVLFFPLSCGADLPFQGGSPGKRVLGWAVLAAQKPFVAALQCFPPLGSVLGSLEGDGTAAEVSTMRVLGWAVGTSGDPQPLARCGQGGLVPSRSWGREETGENLVSLGGCSSAYGNHCRHRCEVQALGRDGMGQV